MTENNTLIAQAGGPMIGPALPPDSSPVFGEITPPDAVSRYGVIGGSGGGPVAFVSNLISLVVLVAGIWTLFNVLLAGFTLVTADGDSKKIGEMGSKITNTFLGLLVMLAAPLLTALIGLFFFGSATYFLQPTIFGPGM